MIVVVDAGPIIHLSWIDKLDLLRTLYQDIVAPITVHAELVVSGSGRFGMERIDSALSAGWLQVRTLEGILQLPSAILELDPGERDGIALVLELDADLFVTDDANARQVAEQIGIEVTGTIGILRRAKVAGLIDEVLPLVLELRQRGQWIGESLLEQIRLEETAG